MNRAVFADTSALYALLVAEDLNHGPARDALARLREGDARLVTSSFVLQETIALLQSRCGIGAVRRFREAVLPMLDVVWVDEAVCSRALASLLAASRRKVSLTDWSSFEIMRDRGIQQAFAFDSHFKEQGFQTP